MKKPDFDKLATPIVPERVRQIAGQGFGFLPHRFLKDGFLTSIYPDELLLYVFLLLAANRYGVSFYSYPAICSILGLHLDRYLEARNGLIARDLIAFDGRRFQVLSLPKPPLRATAAKPLHDDADFEEHDSATIRAMILESLNRK